MTEIKYERGSEWRKWDLHTHTKGTQKNDQFSSATFEEFCNQMLLEAINNQIHVIGITDYFNLKNYKKLKVYIEEINSKGAFDTDQINQIENILILPNVELRMLPSTDSGKLINIHCLFNPEINFLESLENDFFASLHDSDENKMNRQGITSLGKSLDSSISDNDIAYKKGIDNFHIDVRTLKKLFKEKSNLRENTIIAVSNSNKDGASGLQKHYDLFEGEDGSLDGVRKNIYELSQAIFSGNPKDRLYFLGLKNGIGKELIIQKCGSLKPCIHGSDAHAEPELFKPKKDRYCWIKADPTFEGLKQIICEPEDRVLIQESKPEEKSGYQVIDSIEINSDMLNQKIKFNPNLNTIIGGRSTGKSTLLKLIALKIAPSTLVEERFINDLSSQVKIKWQDNEEDIQRDIEYFNQGYMHEIASRDEKKNSLIEKIVKTKEINTELENYEIYCSKNQREIQSDIDKLFEVRNDTLNLNESIKHLGDLKGLEKEIQTINSKIKELNSDSFTNEQLAEFEQLMKSIRTNNQNISILDKNRKELKILKNKSLIDESFVYSFNKLSEDISKQLNSTLKKISKAAQDSWNLDLTQILDKLKDEIVEIKSANQTIKEKPLFKQGLEQLDKNNQYKELTQKLDIETNKKNKITSLQKQIEKLQIQESALLEGIIEKHNNFSEKINDLVNSFSVKHQNIEINIKCLFQKENCKSILSEFVNLQGSTRQNYVDEWVDTYENSVKDKTRLLLKNALDNKIKFKVNKNAIDFTKQILTKNWFSISYQLTYENDTFNTMSDGKKAFVVLNLLLEFSDKKCPILIDQPEDSLDNRAIYNELVQYIKKKKKERQIILVTHNANVVVNADAEEVIVANQNGQDSKNTNDIKFEYVSGSLENTFPKDESIPTVLHSQGIREHVCEILEGGTEAFKKREDKYGIK